MNTEKFRFIYRVLSSTAVSLLSSSCDVFATTESFHVYRDEISIP